MKCNTWESGKESAILSVYGKTSIVLVYLFYMLNVKISDC